MKSRADSPIPVTQTLVHLTLQGSRSFGVIWCTCFTRPCISKTAGHRVKGSGNEV